MSRKVTVRINTGTAKWLQWSSLGDRKRSEARAIATRRIIDLWESIRELEDWTPISEFYETSQPSQRRWVRRNCYTLEMAGLIQTRLMERAGLPPVTHVRVKHQ